MRSRTTCLLLAITLVVLSLTITGCSFLAKKAEEKAIQNATGGQAQVNQNNGSVTIKNGQGTFQAGGTYQWPSAMPADVPKFTYGTITAVIQSNTANNKGITVAFTNATPDAFDKYKGSLQNAGWSIQETSQSTDGFMISAGKDKRTVMVIFNTDSDKGLSGTVVYAEVQ